MSATRFLMFALAAAACSSAPPDPTPNPRFDAAADVERSFDGDEVGGFAEGDCRPGVAVNADYCTEIPSFRRPEKARCLPEEPDTGVAWQCRECYTDLDCLADERCVNASHCIYVGPPPGDFGTAGDSGATDGGAGVADMPEADASRDSGG